MRVMLCSLILVSCAAPEPVCEAIVDAEVPFREPHRAPRAPFSALERELLETQAGQALQFDLEGLPATSSSGELFQYWLTGDESVELTLRVGRSAGSPNLVSEPLMLVALLDGIQQEALVDGQPVRAWRGTLRGAPAARRVQLVLSGAAIPQGAHLLDLLLLSERSGAVRTLSFDVYKDSTRAEQVLVAAPPGAETSGAGGYWLGDAPTYAANIAPTAEPACGAPPSRMAALVIDGEQRPLGELGLRPLFTDLAPEARTLYSVPLAPWLTGDAHWVLLVELTPRLTGNARYTAEGSPNARWSAPVAMSFGLERRRQ